MKTKPFVLMCTFLLCFCSCILLCACNQSSEELKPTPKSSHMGDVYHAWISTYIKDIGWINGIIEFDGDSWNLMDPTFASTSSSPTDFITENSKYITKYVY